MLPCQAVKEHLADVRRAILRVCAAHEGAETLSDLQLELAQTRRDLAARDAEIQAKDAELEQLRRGVAPR